MYDAIDKESASPVDRQIEYSPVSPMQWTPRLSWRSQEAQASAEGLGLGQPGPGLLAGEK